MTNEKKGPHPMSLKLDREALHRDAQRLEAMSDEALDREAEAKGLNPQLLRERGAALAASLRRQSEDAARAGASAGAADPGADPAAETEQLAPVIPLAGVRRRT